MSIFKNDRKFVVISVLLHGVLAFTLALIGAKSNIPFGVARQGSTIVEFSMPSANPSSNSDLESPKRPAVNIESVATDASAQLGEKEVMAATTTLAQPLGFADGVQAIAPLGQSDGTANTEKDRYLYELRVLIEQKKVYPQISKRLRETGTVVVRFQVLKDGRIEAVDLKTTSSFSRLNEAALGLIRGIEKFRPLPQAVANDQASLEILLPIEYVLN